MAKNDDDVFKNRGLWFKVKNKCPKCGEKELFAEYHESLDVPESGYHYIMCNNCGGEKDIIDQGLFKYLEEEYQFGEQYFTDPTLKTLEEIYK